MFIVVTHDLCWPLFLFSACAQYCLTMGSVMKEWLSMPTCISTPNSWCCTSYMQLSASWPAHLVSNMFLTCAWTSRAPPKLSGIWNIMQLWLCVSYRESKMIDCGSSSHCAYLWKCITFRILLFLKTINKIIRLNVTMAIFLCYELLLAISSSICFLQGNWWEFQQPGNVGPWHNGQLQWKSVKRTSLQTDCWV